MSKAGGILAIIAGLLGLLAALATLFMGGLGAAFSAGGAAMVVGLGWGGILFSLLVVVYGATAFTAPRAGATGLALSAVAGMVLGGTLVAILMFLALIAAVMVWLGKKKAEESQPPVTSRRWKGMAGAAVAPVLAAVLIGGQLFGAKESAPGSATGGPDVQIAQVGQTAHSRQFDVTVRGLLSRRWDGASAKRRGLRAPSSRCSTCWFVAWTTRAVCTRRVIFWSNWKARHSSLTAPKRCWD